MSGSKHGKTREKRLRSWIIGFVYLISNTVLSSYFYWGYVEPVSSLKNESRKAIVALVFLFWGLVASTEASAHAKSVSYSNWTFEAEEIRVTARVSLLELSRLDLALPITGSRRDAQALQGVGQYLADHLQAITEQGPCPVSQAPKSRPTEEGWLLFRWTVHCPLGADVTLRSDILLDPAPSHLHFARAKLKSGVEGTRPVILERVLNRSAPRWTLPWSEGGWGATVKANGPDTTGTSFQGYLILGIEHILSGWDHLAFVLALILLARSFSEIAKLITGFTLAHSLTLALAVLGWVEPQSAPIEAMIGFSVALIAMENGWILGGRGRFLPILVVGGLGILTLLALGDIGQLSALSLLGLAVFSASHFGLLRRAAQPHLHRILLAFAFGLIHGFGFAGVLAELSLPTHRLAPALIGFNLGVELGQLAVVAVVWPALSLLRKRGGEFSYRLLAEAASASICGIGLYWFLIRALS